MFAPVKWLKDYINIDMDTVEFADKMTMTGSKVEKVEEFGSEIENVVVGKIIEISKHENADKLQVTKVDVGDEIIQIVTGANNIKLNDYVPIARVGAKLPGGIKIKKGKLRGVESFGMMCSSEELGIANAMVAENKKDGIYILDEIEDIKAGYDVKELLGINDYLIEFEITSNRPDCLSMIGLAREGAVILNQRVKMPDTSVEEIDKKAEFKISINDTDLCKKYGVRIVEDVKIKPSPYWMQRRLIESGVRPINNIVDITNYVMLEMGLPLHAFDMSKVGDEIIVRRAKDREKVTTLDDVERTLNKDMLVIANGKEPIAIAGIMGCANSEIDDSTNTILIEGALFDASSIRHTSKVLGLRSEASSRFEKGIDINLTSLALDRVCNLINKLGAGKVLSGMIEECVEEYKNVEFSVSIERINALLGCTIHTLQFKEILESLDFECEINADIAKIKVPSFRLDVKTEADILEEIARIYGYENIPSSFIYGTCTMGMKTKEQIFEERVKSALTSMGLNEILTYSFVSPKGVDKINVNENSKQRDFITILNPLGEETSVMRTTLVPNMLDVVCRNNSRKVEEFAAFEIGNTFTMEDSKPVEKRRMSIALYGNVDFFDIKGIIEELFNNIGIKNYEISPNSDNLTFHPGRCADIIVGGSCAAAFGELHPRVLKNYDISKPVYVADIDFEKIMNEADQTKSYTSLPKYPAINRDLAVIVKENMFVKEIEDVIKLNSKGLVKQIKLFDVYKGSQIDKGYKSVAYSITYRSDDKTLTDEQVNPVHEKIVSELEQIGAKLR